jgi:hypothetical protein
MFACAIVACKSAPPGPQPAPFAARTTSLRPVRMVGENGVRFINKPTPRLPAGMSQIGAVHAKYRVHMSAQGRVLDAVAVRSLGANVDQFVIQQLIATWRAQPQPTPYTFIWQADLRAY